MKIAIIGVGMVGNAVYQGSGACSEICLYDKFRPELCAKWDQAWQTELCFVCVPTPTVHGRQDTTAVVDACRHLRSLTTLGYKGVVAIKSTVLPGTMRWLQHQFTYLRLVHNPEFLCERTARLDYIDQCVMLLSGQPEDMRVVRRYAGMCLNLGHVHSSEVFEHTEWAKYLHNCMLPVQLSFLNEMYDLIGNQHTYDSAIEMARWFGNVGERSKVPGPDGLRGWGGSCFPKDTKALESFALIQGFTMNTLTGAIKTNSKVRNQAKEPSNGK